MAEPFVVLLDSQSSSWSSFLPCLALRLRFVIVEYWEGGVGSFAHFIHVVIFSNLCKHAQKVWITQIHSAPSSKKRVLGSEVAYRENLNYGCFSCDFSGIRLSLWQISSEAPSMNMVNCCPCCLSSCREMASYNEKGLMMKRSPLNLSSPSQTDHHSLAIVNKGTHFEIERSNPRGRVMELLDKSLHLILLLHKRLWTK